jgi:hypothetical protein
VDDRPDLNDVPGWFTIGRDVTVDYEHCCSGEYRIGPVS